MALKAYRYKPSRSTGVTNIVMVGGALAVGIVAAVRGEFPGSGWFLAGWIGLFVVMIAGIARTSFSKRGSTRILLPGGGTERWAATARTLGTVEPEEDDRR